MKKGRKFTQERTNELRLYGNDSDLYIAVIITSIRANHFIWLNAIIFYNDAHYALFSYETTRSGLFLSIHEMIFFERLIDGISIRLNEIDVIAIEQVVIMTKV